MKDDKVDIGDILLNRRPKHDNTMKIALAIITLSVILGVVIMLMNSLTEDIEKRKHLKQAQSHNMTTNLKNDNIEIKNTETELKVYISNKNVRVNTSVKLEDFVRDLKKNNSNDTIQILRNML